MNSVDSGSAVVAAVPAPPKAIQRRHESMTEDADFVPIQNVIEIMQSDATLAAVLEPLEGMEGSLLLSFGADSQYANVMAKIVSEVSGKRKSVGILYIRTVV